MTASISEKLLRVLGRASGPAKLLIEVFRADELADTTITGEKPNGVPDDWIPTPPRKGEGWKWVNPHVPRGHEYVRVRRDGTITQVRNGKAYDVNGNLVDLDSPAAHGITPEEWVFRP